MIDEIANTETVKSTMTRKSFILKSGWGLLGLSLAGGASPIVATQSKKIIKRMNENEYEVVVIGGSYAGLSSAMTLGRSLRKTLILDSGKPCNRQTPHSRNFITQDGRKPADIADDALNQVLKYATVQKIKDLAIDVQGQNGAFTVQTQSGNIYQTKKLLFATGVKDIMPDIPGFAESWGITAIHCPYCHGYEVRGKRTGILVNNESAYDFAKLVRHWTSDLKIFTNGDAQFDREMLSEWKVEIMEEPIARILHQDGYISSIQFQDGSHQELDALYHRPAFVQHCTIPEKMGCELTETGHLKVTEFQQTIIPGVYATGDCTTPFRSVANAVAQGNIGAAMLNHELIHES